MNFHPWKADGTPEPWKLNNDERQKEPEILKNLEKEIWRVLAYESTNSNSRFPKGKNGYKRVKSEQHFKKWLEHRKMFWYNFLESLILAQDERWRRA